jgi:hypothetical protein
MRPSPSNFSWNAHGVRLHSRAKENPQMIARLRRRRASIDLSVA